MMMKKLFCVLLVLALCAAGAVAEGQLTVQGTGVVSLDADTATVTLGIRQYATDVKEAQAAVNQVIDAVIAALTEAGVAREDLYTNSIYIYPEYDYDSYSAGERIRGYNAGNTLTITTGNVDEVGAYIDAAFDAGANTLDDVSFSASDTGAAYDEAIICAIADARRKAGVMAEAAGLELGDIVSISEGEDYSYNPTSMYARAVEEDAGGVTQVIAAMQRVTAKVTVVFDVK